MLDMIEERRAVCRTAFLSPLLFLACDYIGCVLRERYVTPLLPLPAKCLLGTTETLVLDELCCHAKFSEPKTRNM